MAEELLLTGDEIRFAAGTIEGEIDLSDLTMALMTGVAEAQLAKVHKHRMDRSELREKIAIRLHTQDRVLLRVVEETNPCNCSWEELPKQWRQDYLDGADQILALIPTEEEIRRQIEAHGDICFNTGIAEGKIQERERMEALFADTPSFTTFIRARDNKAGVEECYLIMKSEWQALKEGV